ncbi:response regulator [uncultured Odoribacter sp.]|uniref:response regulator n=1 Tax=uncultured Odoribacter sp. TaxID=876416 RepID=UPI002621DC93|nr:response regulator [uncultured Odoribacter sp.]
MNDNEKTPSVLSSGQNNIETPTASNTLSEEKETLSFKPMILIAEDNSDNYLLLKCILQSNYTLLHAWNGKEAIELYKQQHPQLVLMDIRMPGIDGFEATAEIRKISTTVPIIAITAYAYAQDIEQILKSGFNNYISKPIDVINLKEKVREIFEINE